jgi:hypothetical protein
MMGCALAPLIAPAAAQAQTKRIFTIPATQWDNGMTRDHPARIYSASDLGNLTGGIMFGLSPVEVNAQLPDPAPGMEWSDLPFANEYPDEVRYFWVRVDAMKDLRAGITGCFGANSYIVFFFRSHALFRVSWRLLADKECPSPHAAAEDIYARYLTIDRSISLATHYQPNNAEVVEITDPNADYLIPYRWANRQRR